MMHLYNLLVLDRLLNDIDHLMLYYMYCMDLDNASSYEFPHVCMHCYDMHS